MSNYTCKDCGKPTTAHDPSCKWAPKKAVAKPAPAPVGQIGDIPLYDEIPFGDFPVSKPANGTPPATVAPPDTHTEAPLSVNWSMRDQHGALVQITMRDGCTSEMLNHLFETRRAFMDRALKAGWTVRKGAETAEPAGDSEDAPLCAIHNKPMVKRSKDGRSWWSCNEKLPDGSWCPYKPKGK